MANKYPEPDKVLREFRVIVFTDESIGFYTTDNQCVSFFADDVIGKGIVENLKEMGEL